MTLTARLAPYSLFFDRGDIRQRLLGLTPTCTGVGVERPSAALLSPAGETATSSSVEASTAGPSMHAVSPAPHQEAA